MNLKLGRVGGSWARSGQDLWIFGVGEAVLADVFGGLSTEPWRKTRDLSGGWRKRDPEKM